MVDVAASSDQMRSLPPPPTRPGRPSFHVQLPAALTPLLGRERELALAGSLLGRDDVRLLTVSGPGGIGKTRLAIEIGRAEIESYADGVVFVPLAAVDRPDQVVVAIARALGVPEIVGVDLHGTLLAALRDVVALLILDNFEHVLVAGPFLTDLLENCPRLKIVVTSRALLRVAGEYALPTPPLILPEPAEVPSLTQIAQSPAARLFETRARAVVPSFTLSEETAPLVAEICRHLDGLPLAIELAAAQVAVLPPAALLARIRARLPLPVTGPRDAPARLRTIGDAVAWSYELLSAEERQLFRRVSVFAASFALDAAEAVGGAGGAGGAGRDGEIEGREVGEGTAGFLASRSFPAPPAPPLLDGLSALVDKSLLRQEAWEGEARYAMLETIRAFAWEQLVAEGEAEAIGDAHAAWALALAERHELAVALPGQERQLRRMEVDHANLNAALAWFERREDNEGSLRLTAALGGFWIAHSHYREGRDWLERALARSPAASTSARGRAQISLGRLISLFGEVERADRLLSDGIAALRADDDAPVTTFALARHAAVANQLGEHDRAERLLNEALDLASTIDDVAIGSTASSTVLANLGVAAHGRGELELARVRHEQALRLCREHGYTLGAIRSLRDLGDVDRDRGDFAGALAHYRWAVELLGERGDLRIVVDALEGTALAAAVWRQPRQAARLLGAAEAFRERYGGAFIVPTDQAAHERALAVIRSTLDEREVDAAWRIGRRLTVAEAIAEIRALAPNEDAVRPVEQTTVKLSPREQDVLRLLVAGLSDRAIAAALFVSVRTVEAHVARILAKLGVRSRTAAVGAALAAGLVESAPPAPG